MKPNIGVLTGEYLSHLSMIKLVLEDVFHVDDASQIIDRIDQYCRSLPQDGMFDILHHDPYDIAVEWGSSQTTNFAMDETFARYEALLNEWRAGRLYWFTKIC